MGLTERELEMTCRAITELLGDPRLLYEERAALYRAKDAMLVERVRLVRELRRWVDARLKAKGE